MHAGFLCFPSGARRSVQRSVHCVNTYYYKSNVSPSRQQMQSAQLLGTLGLLGHVSWFAWRWRPERALLAVKGRIRWHKGRVRLERATERAHTDKLRAQWRLKQSLFRMVWRLKRSPENWAPIAVFWRVSFRLAPALNECAITQPFRKCPESTIHFRFSQQKLTHHVGLTPKPNT